MSFLFFNTPDTFINHAGVSSPAALERILINLREIGGELILIGLCVGEVINVV